MRVFIFGSAATHPLIHCMGNLTQLDLLLCLQHSAMPLHDIYVFVTEDDSGPGPGQYDLKDRPEMKTAPEFSFAKRLPVLISEYGPHKILILLSVCFLKRYFACVNTLRFEQGRGKCLVIFIVYKYERLS